MRDRFQGALLGLSLTPTALSSSTVLSSPLQPDSSDLSVLARAIAIAISSSANFARLDTSAAFFPKAANSLSPTFWLPASIPTLLRYHDSWARRLRRIVPLLSRNTLTVTACQKLAQIAILGDLLEAMDKGLTESGWNTWLLACSARYTDWPQLHGQYQAILSALALQSVSTGRWVQPSASFPINWAVNKNHCSFVQGVTSALTFSESYVLAVNSAAEPLFEPFSGPLANHTIEAVWESVFVSGLLAGALRGKSAVPVLWRMQPNLVAVMAVANDLFSLWAGISTSRDLPN